MFLATSPELEMALYTTCLMTRLVMPLVKTCLTILLCRPDAKCHVTLAGTDVYIQTWRTTVGDNVFVGSSYPDWAP